MTIFLRNPDAGRIFIQNTKAETFTEVIRTSDGQDHHIPADETRMFELGGSTITIMN